MTKNPMFDLIQTTLFQLKDSAASDDVKTDKFQDFLDLCAVTLGDMMGATGEGVQIMQRFVALMEEGRKDAAAQYAAAAANDAPTDPITPLEGNLP